MLTREVEQEAAIFTQAANVDRLLTLLGDLDATGERLADNEELQVRDSIQADRTLRRGRSAYYAQGGKDLAGAVYFITIPAQWTWMRNEYSSTYPGAVRPFSRGFSWWLVCTIILLGCLDRRI